MKTPYLIGVSLSVFCWISSSYPAIAGVKNYDPNTSCQESIDTIQPNDPTAKGSYPVGVKTLAINGMLVELWYPAMPGSNQGLPSKNYELRNFLPERDANKIPATIETLQPCDCYQGLPIASQAGKFPVIFQVHGTAAFRTASLQQATHWASRGFVVIAADHPYIQLKDVLASPLGPIGIGLANQSRDVKQILAALRAKDTVFAEFLPYLDLSRLAVVGHSAGGRAVGQLLKDDDVLVGIALASSISFDGTQSIASLSMAADRDGVGSYQRSLEAHDASTGRAQFIGLKNAGHLAFTDICALNREQGGILQVAVDAGINVPDIVQRLGYDGCADDYLSYKAGWQVINAATSLVLEDVLFCQIDRLDQLKELATELDGIADIKLN